MEVIFVTIIVHETMYGNVHGSVTLLDDNYQFMIYIITQQIKICFSRKGKIFYSDGEVS